VAHPQRNRQANTPDGVLFEVSLYQRSQH